MEKKENRTKRHYGQSRVEGVTFPGLDKSISLPKEKKEKKSKKKSQESLSLMPDEEFTEPTPTREKEDPLDQSYRGFKKKGKDDDDDYQTGSGKKMKGGTINEVRKQIDEMMGGIKSLKKLMKRL